MHYGHSPKSIAGRQALSARAWFGIVAALVWVAPALASSVYPDKPAWIHNASIQLLNNFPKIDAFMWFNINKERDWRVDSSPESLAAYKSANWGTLQQGVYLDSFPNPAPPDVSKITNYETLVGHAQTRVGWYESLDTPFPAAAVNALHTNGYTPYVVWEPFDSSLGDTARSGESRLDDILSGAYDARINAWADAAKAAGGDIEVSFGHEMNGDWFTWGFLNNHNGNSAALYKSAWQYVVDKFRARGATNVKWVWCINASWHDDFSDAYPGTAYIDRLGMNGFNWGDRPFDGSDGVQYDEWRDFEQIFGAWDPGFPDGVNNYQKLVELSGGTLPIIIGEMGSSGTPEPATLAVMLTGCVLLCQRRFRRTHR